MSNVLWIEAERNYRPNQHAQASAQEDLKTPDPAPAEADATLTDAKQKAAEEKAAKKAKADAAKKARAEKEAEPSHDGNDVLPEVSDDAGEAGGEGAVA